MCEKCIKTLISKLNEVDISGRSKFCAASTTVDDLCKDCVHLPRSTAQLVCRQCIRQMTELPVKDNYFADGY